MPLDILTPIDNTTPANTSAYNIDSPTSITPEFTAKIADAPNSTNPEIFTFTEAPQINLAGIQINHHDNGDITISNANAQLTITADGEGKLIGRFDEKEKPKLGAPDTNIEAYLQITFNAASGEKRSLERENTFIALPTIEITKTNADLSITILRPAQNTQAPNQDNAQLLTIINTSKGKIFQPTGITIRAGEPQSSAPDAACNAH